MKLKYVNKDRNGNDVHAYYIDKSRAKNISSVAKFGLDTYNLEIWSQNRTMIGLAHKPALLERVALNIENRAELIKIGEEARNEAGAHEGRDRGNVLHQALEAHDQGERILHTDLTSAAIKSWESILEAMQWEIRFIERCVVWPTEKIAGRFDRIVRGPACATCGGTHFIVDYKGGDKVLDYPHQIVAQLTLYAHAPLLAGPIPAEGGETDVLENMPNMCTCKGYTVHLPADRDARLIEMPLRLDVLNMVIRPIIGWRATPAKSLAKVVELPALSTLSSQFSPSSEDDPFAGLPSDKPEPVMNPFIEREVAVWLEEKQQNLRERLLFLKEEHPSMAQVVASRWPEGVPNIKMPLTADDLDRIEALVIDAERQVEAPFNPISPSQEQPHLVPNPPAEPATGGAPDEGPNIDDATRDAMKAELERLEVDLYSRINEWVAQANNAGTSISLRTVPSKRRFSIARAMLLAVHHHEDVVRAVLSLTLGDEIQTTVTTGSVLGVLTQAEAEKAWEILLGVGDVWIYNAGKLVAA